jgi:TMEM175 potassium channel family protein
MCKLSFVRSGDVSSSAEGPGLDRVITLTDAVVAIAMTLLVLPLVEVAGEFVPADPGSFLGEHGDLLLSFVVSFLVIYAFWAAHGEALHRLAMLHSNVRVVRPLNMCWLLVIAFLPFPTAVVGRDLTTTSAPLYIGTMFVLSALTSTISTVVDRHVGPPRRAWWAWLATLIFAACALLSLANPTLGLLALLLLAVVRVVEARVLRPSPRSVTRVGPAGVPGKNSEAAVDDRAEKRANP